MLRFRQHPQYTKVFLDGRYMGRICRNGMHWHFQPKERGSIPTQSCGRAEDVKLDVRKLYAQHLTEQTP
jgi:hypothetical protein